MPDQRRPHRAAASSPVLAPRPPSQAQAPRDPSIRQMRLKVLYTFDEDKTNCLARWPHALDIRTAFLNAETQVGVIELKTCLQAIATASPEIVAGLGQDYTVYAYDYSEYETPLVGQGMLSWILASASPTPGAPAQQSRTMVTGRVSQNSLGLFSSGSQETLEVKLRLVPVPTSKQSEYLESMKKYRDISQMMPSGFDPRAWASFLQQNPGFMQQAIQRRSQSPAFNGQYNGFGIEHVQRLLSGDSEARSHSTQPTSRANTFANADIGQQLPRLPSPASSVASTATAPKRRGRKPGINYKGPKPRRGKKEQASESTDPGYCTGDERPEEGPSRKRAKVVQTDWDGRQELGKQPDSLRVAASTAASVRIHQPTAVRPGSNPHLALDSQPRAPTPVADPSQRLRKPRFPPSKSNLGQASQATPSLPNESHNPAAVSEKAPDLSPEKSQAESSTADIGSSPPEFFGNSTTQSSPRLPEFPRSFQDSGSIGGTFDDLFGDEENRSLDEDDLTVAAQYNKRLDLRSRAEHEFSGDFFLDFAGQGPKQESQEAPCSNKDESIEGHKPTETTASSNLLLPLSTSDSGRSAALTRSQTWSGNQAPHPASDAGAVLSASVEPERPSRGRTRRSSDMGGQSGVRRKAVIQSRLASSIATGEVPPYCDHCGAIETPTWRKAWAKVHSGSPEHVRISDEEGGILTWQTLQTDSKGLISLYRIIKKTLAKDDEGFKQMLLCNPCGMYLLTRKCMRPKDMWHKSQKDPDDKNEREPHEGGPKPRSYSSSTNPQGTDASLFSGPFSPTAANKQTENLECEPQLPVLRRCKTAVGESKTSLLVGGLDEASAAAALQKAIKSSPHKFAGSEQAPIEIADLTPQPIRRVLFPSPSQSGKAKSRSNPSSEDQHKSPDEKRATSKLMDKENRPPWSEDDIDKFFNEGYASANGPHTPASPISNYPWVKKSPTKSPRRRSQSREGSATKGHLLPPATPRRTSTKQGGPLAEFTPFTAHLNQLLSDATAGSPGAHNFDFPTLPSLRNTPNTSRLLHFDFGQLDSQDLISTDIPMPSSPPPWNFGSFDDNGDGGQQGLWDDPNLPNTFSSPLPGDPFNADTNTEPNEGISVKQPSVPSEAAS